MRHIPPVRSAHAGCGGNQQDKTQLKEVYVGSDTFKNTIWWLRYDLNDLNGPQNQELCIQYMDMGYPQYSV